MSDTLLRYIELLKIVPRNRKMSATDIHRRLSDKGYTVTKRTVERDLQALALPFGLDSDESSKPYGWKYSNAVTISPIPGLSETEALSFLMLKQFAGRLLPAWVMEDLEPYLAAARTRLSEEVSKSATATWLGKIRSVDPHQTLLPPQFADGVQLEVHKALMRNRQLAIRYQALGKPEPRDYMSVNVLGLVEHGTVLYLVVTYVGYEDIRLLALHRVHSARMLDAETTTPAGFNLDTYIASGGFGFGGGAQSIQVELLFHDQAGHHLLETKLSPDQCAVHGANQTLSISATVLDTNRLHWWLLGFGPSVEVIGPPELRERIQRAVVESAARYATKPAARAPHS